MTGIYEGKEERESRIRFLECMDRINRVIHRSDDAEQMLWSVLRETFSIFGCDRIWLFHPCDPASPTYRIPVEITRPEYPGAHGLNLDVPMKPMGDRFCAKVLVTDGPVSFGSDTDPPIFPELSAQFGVRSQLSMAIHPRVGRSWMIGMHQCSHERLWSREERELFEGIARRVGEGLSTLLLLRDQEELVEERTAELKSINAQLEKTNAALEEAQRKVRQSGEHLRLFVEHAPAALAMFDRQMRYISASRRWRRDYALGDRDLRGLCHYDIFPEIPERWKKAHSQGLAGEVVQADEDRFERADGSVHWLRWEIRPWHDGSGALGGIVMFTEDISRLKGAEQELRERQGELIRAKEAADEANRAKSDFLAVMSHEIRTPLSVVIASLDHLLHTATDPQQKSILEMADSSADRLHALIEDILDFSRIEAGRVELRREAFDLRECIGKGVELFRMQAREKGLDLRCEIAPSVPARVEGDPDRLAQVLINLVGNALKFTERGEIAVHAQSGPKGIDISVRDTGIGIAPEQRDRLFKSFSQVDSSLTRRYGGTGLGLAISKALVELMGGTIRVDSAEGKGSVFSFTLPPLPPGVDREQKGEAPATARDPLSPSGGRILLVDDDPLVRSIMELMLSERQWKVVTAAGGRQALEEVARGEFDLILMDLQMPGMSGLEATRAIRERESAEGRRTPIVALTAHVRPEDREKCSEAQMDAFLAKPVTMEALYAAVEKHLGIAG